MKTIYSQNFCRELKLWRVSCKKNIISINWIYTQKNMSVQKVMSILNWCWVRNLSNSKIYKEKQIKQKRQKIANFLKKTRESEAVICLE